LVDQVPAKVLCHLRLISQVLVSGDYSYQGHFTNKGQLGAPRYFQEYELVREDLFQNNFLRNQGLEKGICHQFFNHSEQSI
jgi:hypothetical protein